MVSSNHRLIGCQYRPYCTATNSAKFAWPNLLANCQTQDSSDDGFTLLKLARPTAMSGALQVSMASGVPMAANHHWSHGLAGDADIGSCPIHKQPIKSAKKAPRREG
jgi:hypothetical protein